MNRKHQAIEAIYPLSPMQQGMLFHTIYAAESGVYVTHVVLTLEGPLVAEALQHAWQTVVAQHAVLRTAFVWERHEKPFQVVQRQVKLPWRAEDWRALTPEQQQEQFAVLLDEDLQQGFDLKQAPLIRLTLLQFGATTHRFVWSLHHILLDGWSLPLVLDEVFTCYHAEVAHQPCQLPARRPYREYIAWLQQQDMAQAEAFWRAHLAGFTAPTPLVVDQLGQSSAGVAPDSLAEQDQALAPATSAALQAWVRQHGLTINTLVQGAWALLLSRYSGEQDVLFGATVAGRPTDLPGVAGMVGLFINTLPVRVRLAWDQPVVAWLQTILAQQLAAQPYQHSPLVDIQGWSEVPRGQPLFESFVLFENYPTDTGGAAQTGLTITTHRGIERTNYPLSLIATAGRLLELRITYDRARFSPATVARMLGHLVTLLEAMAGAGDRPLGSLPLLTPAEQQQLAAWNNTQMDYPMALGFHDLFAQQARRTPDRPAVSIGERTLCYGELDAAADRLARRLRQAGVGPELPVGIYLERSVELVVALLAVHKAGGAYVPLDPGFPRERLSWMLADSGAPVLLTSRAYADDAPPHHAQVLYVDQDGPDTGAPIALPTGTAGGHLAYLIYTSGSTGRPKGVMLPHRALTNFLHTMRARPGIGADDTLLAVTTLSFDIAALELFLPLTVGAHVVLADRATAMDGRALAALLTRTGATVMQATPATWQLLLESGWSDGAGLTILCGGEALPQTLSNRLLATGARLWNMYGPTETTIWSLIDPITQPNTPITIGRPIGNTSVAVLDAQLRPVPIGVPGQLYIGGDGLARGYHGRPELTAERFVPDPFAARAGTRLYTTGDLVRWREDGRLEFLGRADFQVKLRGFRIELGEIEAAALSHPAVQSAVVLLREDSLGDQRLVIYVVPRDQSLRAGLPEARPTALRHAPAPLALTQELRDHLAQHLPEYMIPSAVVLLEHFPLTPNGKIDRRALPIPELPAPATLTAPRTPLEEVLAQLWAEVLHLSEVGIHDSFFALGGHSLLATQLIARIRTVLSADLPLRVLFAAPTIAQLAERVQQARSTPELLPPPLEAHVRPAVLPLSFAQQRLWFLAQLDPASPASNVPVALRLRGPLNQAALQDALDALVARHESLRTIFPSQGHQQQILPPSALPLTLRDLTDLPPAARLDQARARAQADAQQPFDLASGPLLRATLLTLGDDEHVLLLTLHHIITDGWSMGVLLDELAQHYHASVSGRAVALAPLPIQYADYALWQRGWLQGAVLEAQLAYWRQQLADLAPLELPTDYARPAVAGQLAATHQFSINAETAAALGRLARQQNVTPFMLLLAVWQLLLARHSGQTDIAIGTPVSNRRHSATDQLIGVFVNTIVLRANLDTATTFQEVLGLVREVCLAAYTHQDLPFEQLVEVLQPTRDLSRHPLFQVLFTLQQATGTPPAWPELNATPLLVSSGTVRFDLSLSLIQGNAGIEGLLEYRSDLFAAATVARLAAHYTTLLAALLAAPDQPLAHISMLSAPEQRQLAAWAQTAPAAVWQGSLPSRLLAQAARTPHALALIDAGTRWSYAELQAAAQHLAAHLAALPLPPDQPIAVLLERTVVLPAAFLAVWLAGAPLLPLDPSQPPARLAQLLADAQPALLLTSAALAASLSQELPATLVIHDVAVLLASPAASAPIAPIAAQHTPTSPAYLLYTSGSTGQPKAVRATHGSLIGILDAISTLIGYQPGDVQPWLASAAFDISLFELFAPLLAGATTHLLSRAAVLALAQDPTPLTHWSVLHAVPSLLRVLLSALETQPQLPRTLRQVLVGGDRVPPDLLSQVQQVLPDAACTVLYGPTETTILATAYVVPPELPGPHAWLGRPLAGVEVRLCDRHGQPVPIGVVGELWIGGVGVSQGYLNQPELTAERFVVLPSAIPTTLPNIQHEGHEEHEGLGDAGAPPTPTHATLEHQPVPQDHAALPTSLKPPASSLRFYRSGDLARWLPDGTLVFVGRQDGQVKLRGFRIELGEIEAVLSQHPAVAEALVRITAPRGDEHQLVAYVVPHAEAGLEAEALRTFVGTQLPDYMVPSAVITLDHFPLTPNGKLDYAALPTPEQPAATQAVAPRTPLEAILAAIWAEVLQLPAVGIHDNFFSLGGHSLLATQVATRVQAALGLALPLRTLFEQPTVAQLAIWAEQTRSDPALLPPPLLPHDRPSVLPLSFAQQRLWFLAQLDPASVAYNMPVALRLRGSLDRAALQHSLDALVVRHESLRTRFVSVAGTPQQLIAPPAPVPLTLRDLSELPPAQRLDQALALAQADAHQPFDLASGPLLRTALLQMAPDDAVLLLNLHHIISDGWSMGVLLNELAQHYRAQRAGRPAALAPLPVQYADYALWQRAWLQGAVLETQLAYWRAQLAELTPLDLPTDYARPSVTALEGAVVPFRVDAPTTAALQALCRRVGVTPFMALLAVWQLLLARHSGQDDIAVGTPIAGRTHQASEPLIGYFVNTLVLRSDLAQAVSFRDLLGQVREVCLAAYAHQDVPFEQLVDMLAPARDLSRHPLIQVMFALQSDRRQQLDWPDIAVENVLVDYGTVKFDLSLSIAEGPDQLMAVLEYRSDLFDATTVARLAAHYTTLLAALLAAPDQPLAHISMLSAPEQQQLAAWAQTAPAATWQGSLPSRLLAQAARTPHAPALIDAGTRWSYAELRDAAQHLAAHLVALPLPPDQPIAVLLERTVVLPAAVLAVWLAGAPLLPLDPSQPPARLAQLLADAQPALLLTSATLAASLSQELPATLAVHDVAVLLATPAGAAPGAAVLAAETPAYLLYTSGSTGQPKAVRASHGSLIGILDAISTLIGYQPGDVQPWLASAAFDISLFELFAPLLAGATTHLLSRAAVLALAQDPRPLAHWSVLHAVPSLLRVLLNALEAQPQLPRRLRQVLVGGDRVPPDLLTQVQQVLPDATCTVLYGPTETTILATAYVVPPAPSGAHAWLGRPLAGVEVRLCDRHGQPVPIGVVGELWIGGVGVSQGYLNQPELTAERFVALPSALPTTLPNIQHEGHEAHEDLGYAPTHNQSARDDHPVPQHHAAQATSLQPQAASLRPGPRFYRSGDLARWLPDGTLVFVGRQDGQVKLRGFRIELGEIEAVLSQHPAVAEALVRIAAPRGEGQLVAYVVPRAAAALESEALRTFVGTQLPDYMVPSAVITLEHIPLTPNGKLDEHALPLPDQTLVVSPVAPRTPLETILAAIWAEVLQLPAVGIHDNFFTLGGHSLLATQVAARVQAALGLALPLRTLFERPTVAQLAIWAEQTRSDPALLPPPLLPHDRPSVLPLSFAQQRLWFLAQLDPASVAYNMPVALRLRGPLDPVALQHSLDALVARHESLRTRFVSVAGTPQQLIAPPAPVPLTLRDLSELPPAQRLDQALALAQADAHQPFDLASGPLLRTALLQLAPDDAVLLLTLHHIISDGWSMGVLLNELAQHYRAQRAGLPAALAPLPIQYADYALWQRAWLQGAVLETQLAYWRAQLAELTPLDLPTDYARPSVAALEGAVVPFRVDAPTTAALQGLCRRVGVTPFMALLAVWQLLLARHSGQDDIAVGTPIAGRTHQASEPLIGYFVNTLVLRSDLSTVVSFHDLLGQVREVCLAAYAHQDVPFEQLVDMLAPARDLSRHPLIQVMFTLQSDGAAPAAWPDLTISALPVETGSVKFDLSLTLGERGAGLIGALEYRSDLFDGTTVTRLAEHYTTLLAALLAAPDQPLARINILSAPEQQQLAAWAQTAPAAVWQGSLPSRLLAQAARTPHAPALIDASTRWSYGELQAAAQHLAAHLVTLPLLPDQPIAVLLERTVVLPAAFLAVWLVGAPLLPLDPSQPPARLAQLLADAQPARLLTSAALAASLPQELPAALAVHDVAVLLASPAASAPIAPIAAQHTPSSPAYLLYTSGSTGQPKAVRASHGSLIGILDAISALIGYQPGDVQPWLASAAFDISLFELFAPLLAGTTTHLLSRAAVLDLAQDPTPLAHWSVLHAVPSLLRVLLNALETQPQLPRTLRQVLVGGDRVPPDLLTQVQQVLPEAACTVLYGPTETTILATAYVVPPAPQGAHAWLGRPLAGVEVRLCDRHGQPVPIGVVGELWIGGVGVSQGYLNQPELTVERFVALPSAIPTTLPNVQHEEHEDLGYAPTHRHAAREHQPVPQDHAALPTSLKPQAASLRPGLRFYRSGDLARYLPDGTLVFVGRQDGQVKLRGFRIELGEIEAVLSRHPAVAEALVRVGQVGATPQLVAYVVPRAAAGLEAEALRTFVGTQLPDYMVPSAVITLDRFPLTPNGKLDLRALPTPEQPAAAQAVAPRTPIESTLAAIWAAVLRVPQVGIHDNFFRLGGDSILSIQIVARAGQAGLRLTPRQLFQHQTIAELAAVATPTGALQAEQGLVQGTAPLTPIQQWFVRQARPAPQHFNQDVLLELPQRVAPAALAAALQALLAHHDALRLRFQQTDGAWQAQHATLPTQPPLTVLDLQAIPAAAQPAVQQAACAAVQASLDLASGPLLRALLLERGPHQPQRLLLVIHHLVVDVVSWGVLLADLRQAVAQQQAGQPLQLPPKTSAWRDWASQLHQYAHSERVAAALPFWQTVLAAELPPMPRDYPQGRNTVADAHHLSVTLDAAETSALLQAVPPVYQTRTPEVLLTALAQLWQQWTGQSQLRLSLEGHGREAELVGELDLSRTVGWFTSVYPLLLTLPPDDDAGAALKAIKEQVRQLPQHGLGYGLLRELTGALPTDPPVELSFNYLGQVDQTLEAADDWRMSPTPRGAAEDGRAPRTHLLDVTTQVVGGQLVVGWTSSAQLHALATIAWLADRYLAALRALIAHCASPAAGGFTPSDFPLAQLSGETLDQLADLIDEIDESQEFLV